MSSCAATYGICGTWDACGTAGTTWGSCGGGMFTFMRAPWKTAGGAIWGASRGYSGFEGLSAGITFCWSVIWSWTLLRPEA